MLLPGHLGGSYLVAAACASAFSRGGQPRTVTPALALFALGAGLVSDADILLAALRVGWDPLGRVASEHRGSFLHTPLFAVAAGLVTLALPLRDRRLWAAVACAAVMTHLLLDSLSIGSGVMWLYPWNDTFYGINLANNVYGKDWGDQWMSRYLAHPLFLIEVALLAAAAFIAWRRPPRLQRRAIPMLLVCLLGTAILSAQTTAGSVRPRVIVTTDPELDDSNSLVRYLLYSADFHTEGLVYASSQFHWRGDGKGTPFSLPNREYSRGGLSLCPCTSWRWKPGERYIDEAVDIYASAYPNLRTHDPAYPTPESLRSKIREGNVEFEGDTSKDTPGSELIKDVLLDDKGGPVYLLAWGGQSTIARALRAIELQYRDSPQWRAIQEKVSAKAVIQAFGDQDGTYASYIRPAWPGIEFRQMATSMWGYGARAVVRPEHASYLSAVWMREHVSSVGPFGAFYRVWRDGRQMVPGDVFDYFGLDGDAEELRAKGFQVWTPPQEKGAWISEGDSSTFMNLIDNGLRAHEDARYGGWGGRGAPDRDATGASPRDYAAARWFGFAQRDFAARLKWTVTPAFAGANHAPRVSVTGGLNITAAPGATVRLTATATDPDRNSMAITWWQYADAGTYPGTISLSTPGALTTTFEGPRKAKAGQTIHVILQVTDDGTPALTAFQRVVVTIGTP